VIDFDHNATTRPEPPVIEAVVDALQRAWHNPSSVHRAGQEARALVENARRRVADLLGVRPRTITFTSSGTESIDLAIRGALAAAPKERRVIVTTPIEHAAVRDTIDDLARRGLCERRLLPLRPDATPDLDAARALIDRRTALVSVQWANNETGTIMPVAALAALARAAGALFHTDAVQWVGRMPTRLLDHPPDPPTPPAHDHAPAPGELCADLLSASAHKFHGPKGVGILYARPGVRLVPVLLGTQELGRRGGTENVPGIAGAGVAAELAARWLADPEARRRGAQIRDHFERRVRELVPQAVVNLAPAANATTPEPRADPDAAPRLWNTTNIAFPRLEAEAILLALSENALCASAGAACSSGSLEPSPVLLAMGIPEPLAHGSIRFSIGRDTTLDQADRAAQIVARVVGPMFRALDTAAGA
jgi:cysteine desulfurase